MWILIEYNKRIEKMKKKYSKSKNKIKKNQKKKFEFVD